MSTLKINFLILILSCVTVQHLSACSCRPCDHYTSYYQRCRCCTFHMVGGKRSPPGLGSAVDKSISGMDHRFQNSLQRKEISDLGLTETKTNEVPQISTLEERDLMEEHRRMKRLMLTFFANPNIWFSGQADTKGTGGSLDKSFKHGLKPRSNRLFSSRISSSQGKNLEQEPDIAELLGQENLRGLEGPDGSRRQVTMPESDNVELLPLPLRKAAYKKMISL